MSTAAAGAYAPPAEGKATLPGLTGWVLFDWSTQPFYTLISTFLFAPYFTGVFVGEPHGAALWGYIAGISAILVAIGSPIIGAMADASGGIKRYIFAIGVVFVIAQALLWYAEPGGSADMRLWVVCAALIIGTACSEFVTVLNNSLMPRLVPHDQLGRISGIGWAVGYIGGIVSLVLMAAFVLIDPATGKTMLGLEPLLANDPSRPADRIVGPLSALWFIIFVTPFFLFTPDAPAKPSAAKVGVGQALRTLGATISNVRRYRNIAMFLVAYLLFIDGLMAIFSFGGIYGASLFGWQSMSLAAFGIVITVAGGIGAFIGGFLDDRLGSKTVILGALILLMIAATGVISVDQNHILFTIPVATPLPERSMFGSTGETAYVIFAILIGMAAGPLQSASRSYLARLAPREHMTEFFGIFAFSGKVSAFAAPITVGFITTTTGSLRLGMATILVYLVIGLGFMLAVRDERAPAHS
jgi:MFS transporter, UMF1 family